MLWLLTSPGHQQPWYWLYRGRILITCVILMWTNDTKCKYILMFPLRNLASKGLTSLWWLCNKIYPCLHSYIHTQCNFNFRWYNDTRPHLNPELYIPRQVQQYTNSVWLADCVPRNHVKLFGNVFLDIYVHWKYNSHSMWYLYFCELAAKI